MGLRALALGVACAALAHPASGRAGEYVGALHEHSGYSDGWPGSTPRNYFAAGRAAGLDFMGSGEHSDNADVPTVLSEYCAQVPDRCVNADPVNPLDAFRKWDATLEQAQAASSSAFTAFRGFEWTSDRFGHINVYFSSEDTNAKADGGYATIDAFYAWLTRPAALAGGSDGLATFNHPGAKSLSADDPGFNWDDFRYVATADPQMVGIETFNDRTDYGSVGAGAKGDPPPEGWYARALDKGWHVGAVGAEDLGHDYDDDWGGPDRAKTVLLADDRSPGALQAAMRARRMYAIRRPGIGLSYTVDGQPLGSRLARRPGEPLRISAEVRAPAEGSDLHLDLITSGGAVVASSDEQLDVTLPASASQRYYYVRARRGAPAPGEPLAYSSPVWVSPAEPGGGGATGAGGAAGGASSAPSGPSGAGPQTGASPLRARAEFRRRPLRSTLRRRRALRVRVVCTAACDVRLVLRTRGSQRHIGMVGVRLPRAGSRTVAIGLPRAFLAGLSRGDGLTLTLTASAVRTVTPVRVR